MTETNKYINTYVQKVIDRYIYTVYKYSDGYK